MAGAGAGAPRYRDARWVLLAVGVLGDLAFGRIPSPQPAHKMTYACMTTAVQAISSEIINALRGPGGLIFGWNGLSLMLKQQGDYTEGCTPYNCAHLPPLP